MSSKAGRWDVERRGRGGSVPAGGERKTGRRPRNGSEPEPRGVDRRQDPGGARWREGCRLEAAAGGEGQGYPAAEATEERRLLVLARRGDPDAFADLVAPYQRRLFNLALRLVGDRDLAADLTQDALLRAYRSLGRFRGEARFATWLSRITHNACLDALRWRSRHPAQPLDAVNGEGQPRPEVPDPGPGPEAGVLRGELQAVLVRALDALDPEFRAAVILRDVQGRSYEEAAAIAGIPVGTLKSRLHRGRAHLRELLAPAGVVPSGGAR